MYQPPHFREEDPAAMHALIRAHPLGLMISSTGDGPVANAVPFHLDEASSPKGVLQCHVARANPQWRDIAAGAPVLVVFQGVDTYVTPSWYETKRETGKVVPTWNYAIVQVRGAARIIEDAAWLRRQIEVLTKGQEGARDAPWAVGDAPEAFIAAQIKGIVGIEIEIAEIAGKWKVSQNRPESDRKGVAAGLVADGDDGGAEMAGLVRHYGKLD